MTDVFMERVTNPIRHSLRCQHSDDNGQTIGHIISAFEHDSNERDGETSNTTEKRDTTQQRQSSRLNIIKWRPLDEDLTEETTVGTAGENGGNKQTNRKCGTDGDASKGEVTNKEQQQHGDREFRRRVK